MVQEAMNRPDLLRDARGRRIRYLRVSLTDRCNFRCRYCMPFEGVPKLRHEDMLSLEELAAVIDVLVTDLGLEKVRVTGGEPLVRRGAAGFLRAVGAIPGIRDLSLTTNAYYLAGMADEVRAAGVARLNISLDTLRRDRFERFTRVDGLEQVLAGIEAARRAGFAPIKLNTVVVRENLDEAADLVRFAMARDLEARFIELMPSHAGDGGEFVSALEVLEKLRAVFDLEPIVDREARPSGDAEPPAQADDDAESHCSARLYRIDGGPHRCGLIAPVSEPFCMQCDRIRLRGDGQVLPCLSEDRRIDLKPFVRPSLRRAELAAHLTREMAASKAEPPRERRIQGMWTIGG